tara:strand:+ start:2134 stop:2574 length:441 start_codon:yes stop_codon:yes gene_type:complete
MKLDQLRKIIREEVKSAIKEELQDMLNEAVRVASQPTNKPEEKLNQYKPVTQDKVDQKWSVGKINPGTVPLSEMLNQTAANTSTSELSQIMGYSSPSAPKMSTTVANQLQSTGNMPGIDLSSIPGINNASKILKASYEKDKNKNGI